MTPRDRARFAQELRGLLLVIATGFAGVSLTLFALFGPVAEAGVRLASFIGFVLPLAALAYRVTASTNEFGGEATDG